MLNELRTKILNVNNIEDVDTVVSFIEDKDIAKEDIINILIPIFNQHKESCNSMKVGLIANLWSQLDLPMNEIDSILSYQIDPLYENLSKRSANTIQDVNTDYDSIVKLISHPNIRDYNELYLNICERLNHLREEARKEIVEMLRNTCSDDLTFDARNIIDLLYTTYGDDTTDITNVIEESKNDLYSNSTPTVKLTSSDIHCIYTFIDQCHKAQQQMNPKHIVKSIQLAMNETFHETYTIKWLIQSQHIDPNTTRFLDYINSTTPIAREDINDFQQCITSIIGSLSNYDEGSEIFDA